MGPHRQSSSESTAASNKMTLPCLGRNIVQLDGTRNYLRCQRHNLGGPQSRPEASRQVQFVIPTSTPNIQKKSLEGKGANIVVCPFSSHDKTVVHKSILEKHTNRYLRPTNHSTSAMPRELPSRSARAAFHRIDLQVNP